jgi:hypothetical protein
MMLSALTTYGMWMGSNNIRDEILELVFFLLIGLSFLFSICQFIVMDPIIYTGSFVFLLFVGMTIITLTQPNTLNGVSNRNLTIGLGIGSLIPVISISIGEYLASEPIHIPVNLD